MDKRKYVFIGNRFYCLSKMLALGLDIIDVIAVKGSFLERELINRCLSYTPLESKVQLIQYLQDSNFDVLVSNGCPYILPISNLKKDQNLFVNIHPSLLPDLKGRNPINGAILYQRRHGVTCHIMDDWIDTGNIITQLEIPGAAELPLDLLYQISFRAEGEVFFEAYKRDFRADDLLNQRIHNSGIEPIYYSRQERDMIIQKGDAVDLIDRKVRAFQLEGLFARLERKGHVYKVHDFSMIKNEFLSQTSVPLGHILMIFDKSVLTKEECLCLWRLDTTEGLAVGEPFLL